VREVTRLQIRVGLAKHDARESVLGLACFMFQISFETKKGSDAVSSSFTTFLGYVSHAFVRQRRFFYKGYYKIHT